MRDGVTTKTDGISAVSIAGKRVTGGLSMGMAEASVSEAHGLQRKTSVCVQPYC